MNINGATLDALYLGVKTVFNNAFTATQTEWQEIAMEVPSSAAFENYKWLGNIPQMRLWVGKKNIQKLDKYDYVIKNQSYEATIEIARDDIEDNQIAGLNIQASSVGESAKKHPDQLVYQAVNGGFTNKCFDGQPFFSANHKVGKTTFGNKGTKKLSSATAAAADASIGAAIRALEEITDENGESLGVKPVILLVPPALRATATRLMNNEKLGDDSENPYRNTAKVVVSGRIKDPNHWFLLDTSKPVKPFIYQKRKAAQLVRSTGSDSSNVFMEGVYYYGVEARGNSGYGFWQLAFGSDGTEA
ncbi:MULTISPECIES: Mu-like prophage major head subunit gpT family protein [unclassified Acinetobacter]|uniref:Mu-like prophage major head subunit gpT family protein n=1 Tax=unclassified Acinetobacter TaxID=196816 RepID=UPI001909B015|nr:MULTISPECIES: Mu-like prophage major head subunit gpT family protein [unclassified Acinetobacter]MBK0063962.1 Mu-like prophage major head subunit gpT family protein [Acinetobacter sp. S55]MBK0067247.1 Mu-like prophage major head subunit gpT family protein [Acinetobacter sp. S54]